MHAPIRHRGPDGESFLSIGSGGAIRVASPDAFRQVTETSSPAAAIAFRWLQIQDGAEAASQPMVSADGKVWLALNGEIYNFRELAEELASRGHRFHTHSDTEVVLAAFLEWGTACFERFNGMWAVVLVDTTRHQVIVSRDRLGIKPLFFARRDSSILFASEAKQIACSGESSARPNVDAIAQLVTEAGARGGHSFFDGITPFPPGCLAVIDFASPRIEAKPYWRLIDAIGANEGMTFAAATTRLEELLTSSVAMELTAEVGVGTLLSGGLDSSLVTTLAAASDAKKRPAFSFILRDRMDRTLDESPYIDDVARHCGVPSRTTTMDGTWIRDNMIRVTRAQEAPVTGAPVLAQFRTHELAASEGVRVVLDGQGADEMFGGYIRHQALLLNDLLRTGHPVLFGRELSAFRRANRGYPVIYLRRGLISPLAGPLARSLSPRKVPAWFRGERPGTPSRPALPIRSSLTRALYRDVTERNLPAVLGITDRNSMAHSLEARVPFLDHRIVELAFNLPPAFKIGGGMRKRIVREIGQRHLPQSVLRRTDSIGFGTPQGRWMHNALRGVIEDAAEADVIQHNPIFDGAAARSLVKKYLSGKHSPEEERQVWNLYALRTWFETFGIRG
jgi:asparagine synthase (glutamine-hydrolysing)